MPNESMFTDSTALNEAIDRLLAYMAEIEPNTPEYKKYADLLTQLYKLKEIDIKLFLQEAELTEKQNANAVDCELKDLEIEAKKREIKLPFGVKADTAVLVLANLAGLALVLHHERLNVVTSKAFGMITKLRS
jgi:hypothetical protein